MSEILIKEAGVIATFDDTENEYNHTDIRIKDGVITEIGTGFKSNGTILYAHDCLVTPGLINTHHHLFQTLTRAVPEGQDALLFGWLKALYPIWARFGPEEIFTATQTGLAELALSGCTLSADHLYIFPNGSRLDDSIAAAHEIGIRLLATRGSMSIGQSQGGLPPDSLTQSEDTILADCIRVADQFHSPAPGAMVQIGLAPCSPFSVSRELMRDSAILAREKGLRLHTHLAENEEDIAYSLAHFGLRPGAYIEELGWTGPDVWHAHCVKLSPAEIEIFARTKTAVAHCPCSNCRLGSGIAPIVEMRKAGVCIGLGVDGSASNDSGNLINEARQAMLLQRVANGADTLCARAALRLATRGGAATLGRDDLGQITPGKRADLAIWDMSRIEVAGSWDMVSALVFCGPSRVRDLIVEGRQIVADGHLLTVDLRQLANKQNQLARALSTHI